MSYLSDVASVFAATNKSEVHINADSSSFIDRNSMIHMSQINESCEMEYPE
jgi:hypothetical protein